MKRKALPIAAALFAVALMGTNSTPASASGLLAPTSGISNSINSIARDSAVAVELVGSRSHRRGFRGGRHYHGRHYHGRSFHHGRYIGGRYYGGRYYKKRRFGHHRGQFGRSGLRTERRSGFSIGPGYNNRFGFRGGQK